MGFLVQYADWVLGVYGIYVTYLVNYKRSRWGNHNLLALMVAWVVYGFMRGQYGYMPSCAISAVVLVLAIRRQYVENRSVRAVEVENG